MKTKIILLAFLCFYIQSFAQLNNNSLVIGGNFSFQKQFPKNGGLTLLRINPEIGLVYKNKWESGLLFSFSSTKFYGIEINTNTLFGGGIYTKRYFQINDKIFFALRGSLSTGIQSMNNSSNRFWYSDLTIAPSFTFFPIKNFSINAGVGILGLNRSDNKTSITINSTNFSLGVSYFITPKCKKTTKN